MTDKVIKIISLPNAKDFPEPPSGQPGSIKAPCPKCEMDAWWSKKKRQIIAETHTSEMMILCYSCFAELAKKYPEIISSSNIKSI